MKKQSKISKCREIMEVLMFLNIPTEMFSILKQEKGGLDGLHNWCEKQLF